MLDPGAKRSTQLPKFENEDRASVLVVDPTEKARVARAGENPQASRLLLPAATITGTPALKSLVTALSTVVLAVAPSDILATAGLIWFAATQSIPAITPLVVPEPALSSTLTETRFTPFAIPKVFPPMVPAT